MISVIIPAHNEAAVIGRCLSALLDGHRPEELEIVVVCNGCSDETAAVAAGFGVSVRVVETQVASKIHALNLGDREAMSFPRVYLDADVVLPLAALRRLAECLRQGPMIAAGPIPRFETGGCSWPVKAFYRINSLMPAVREGIGGTGAYALSASARARFAEFPEVMGDDAFVRLLFAPTELTAVDQASCTVFVPRTLENLIAIKTRSHLGNYQLRQLYPELRHNRPEANNRALLRLLLKPWIWPSLAVYFYVKLQARRRARRTFDNQRREHWVWVRDDTSRGSGSGQGLGTSVQHAS